MMGVRGERMPSHKHTRKGRRNRWEDRRAVEPHPEREMEIWTSSLVVFRKMPLESSRVRVPEPSHGMVTSQLPSGQVSWGLPGRWLPRPILFALALPQPLECISWCLPGRPICWPHLSWRALPRAPLLFPDTWHLRGTYFRDSLSLCSLSEWKEHWP